MHQTTHFKYIIFSLIASSVFATIAPFAVAAEQAGLTPVYSVLFRIILLVGLATPFIYIFARKKFKFTKQQLFLMTIQGIASTLLNLCYLGALSFIPISLAVIIFFTFPIITLLVSPFIYGGRLSWVKLAIFFSAFVGLCLVVGPKFSSLDPIGITLAFTGAIFAVVQLLLMNKLVKELNAAAFLYSVHFISMISTILVVGGLYLTGLIDFPKAFNVDMSLNFAAMVICYIVAFGLFALVSRYLLPTTISLISNIEPVVTIAIAVIVFSEILLLNQQIGIAVVLGTLVASSLIKSR